MGGRGGSSGLGKSTNNIPDASDFKPVKPPELHGSEKQVSWAKSIRKTILRELALYTVSRNSEGNPSGLYEIAKQGKEAIKNDVYNSALTKSAHDKKIREKKIEDKIDGYRDLANRIKRYNEIASNTSAAFWIDNRTDFLENYMNKKFKKKIDGK